MAVAAISAKRSKLENKVGAVIVTDDNRIVGAGYNGTPLNHPDPGNVVCDATTNAILFRCVADLRGTSMFTTALPSPEAAKLIVQSRIKILYFLERSGVNVPEDIASLFATAQVDLRHFIPQHREVVVNFAALGETREAQLPEQPSSNGRSE
ncbi:deoxycytidylate deaminase-like isoform X2 [Lineus longissimus]